MKLTIYLKQIKECWVWTDWEPVIWPKLFTLQREEIDVPRNKWPAHYQKKKKGTQPQLEGQPDSVQYFCCSASLFDLIIFGETEV